MVIVISVINVITIRNPEHLQQLLASALLLQVLVLPVRLVVEWKLNQLLTHPQVHLQQWSVRSGRVEDGAR